jgi:hypothetical protein
MSSPIETPKLQKDESSSVERVGRRRFIRGVGIAVPVVMSVKSPSALAAGQCFAPSAHASIALLNSRRDGEKLYCDGGTPGFWGNAAKIDHQHHSYWKQVFGDDIKKKDGSFKIASPLFGTVFRSQFSSPDKKVHEVIWLNGAGDPFQLGAHLVAAYCNVKIGWVPSGEHGVLDISDLQEMWAKRLTGYEPTAGVKWYGQQIVAYLQTTMLRS